jgi:dienelactone hydrolase
MLATAEGNFRVITWKPGGRAAAPAPLVLYAPGWGNRADDSASLLADLASHGYVVAAFDDIVHDPYVASESARSRADRSAKFSMENPAAYRRTAAIAGRRVDLAARKATAVLDALLRAPDLTGRIERERIGAVGFSFGGATLAEQSLEDKRIKAIVNLDGGLWGKSAIAPPTIPYLLVYVDDDLPPAEMANSHDPALQALVIAEAFDHHAHRPLLGRPDFFWLRVPGISHTDLGDSPLWITWRQRLGLASAPPTGEIRRRKAAQFTVIRAFLDRYLRARGAAFPPRNRAYPGGMTDVQGKDLLA